LDVKKRYSEEQIIGFLKEAESGVPIKELCRRHGFSEASYYLWRSKFGTKVGETAKGEGKYIVLEPSVEDGRLKWSCYGQDLPDKELPSACR
jgi:putative transposase